MSAAAPFPTREDIALVHDALNRLYDSSYLQTHPLAEVLAAAETGMLRRSQNLRRVLLNTIRAMRPAAGIPAQSPDWRAYRLLELRYIEGLTPTEVMRQLAISRTQFFREQARMLETLTAVLWEQARKVQPPSLDSVEDADATREQLAVLETERLYQQATWEVIDLVQLLEQLRAIVNPLAATRGAAIHFDLPARLMLPHADRMLARQALLNAISYALDCAQQGQVRVSGTADGPTTTIQVLVLPPATNTADGVKRQGVGLDICRRCMVAMGGVLETATASADGWEARLRWREPAPRVLLAIDDNQGFVDLFRRYLAADNWQVAGAVDGAEARRLILSLRPTVITLDIMLPHEDGWELMLALRANEQARGIPIVICSVLNEPDLATALGATAYLPKPVTQAALLRALAPWNQAGASREPAF